MTKNLPNRSKSTNWLFHFAGVTALALTAGVYYCFAYTPLVEANEKHATRIEQLNTLLSTSSEVEKQHDELRQELNLLKRSVESTHDRLPSDLHEGEFITEAKAIAEKVGLEIEDYLVGDREVFANYSKAEISLQCRGSFASICRFLVAVDHLSRITEVSSIELATHRNFESYPVHVTFVLYYGAAAYDR